jgi:putative transposase
VADFTYVPLATGRFCYTAFVIDAYAGLIPGWECSASKETEFIESALLQAVEYRKRKRHALAGFAVHHSDAGSQYTSVRFTETLMLEGLSPSIVHRLGRRPPADAEQEYWAALSLTREPLR